MLSKMNLLTVSPYTALEYFSYDLHFQENDHACIAALLILNPMFRTNPLVLKKLSVLPKIVYEISISFSQCVLSTFSRDKKTKSCK